MLSSTPFLDTSTYGTAYTLLFLGGFAVWVPAYLVIVLRARRFGWLEIPLAGACGDVAWDALSAFVFAERLGWGVEVFFGIAFVLDLLLVAAILRWPSPDGSKSSGRDPRVRMMPWVASGIVGSGVLVWAFRHDGLDIQLGTRSAYLIAIALAAGYVWEATTLDPAWELSRVVGWCKLVGDGMVSVFVFRHDPTSFGRLLTAVLTALDVVYVGLLMHRATRRTTLS